MTQYDKIGELYKNKINISKKEEFSKNFILNEFDPNNQIVVDLGCGYGRDIELFEQKGAKLVYGLDDSEYMVKETKKVSKTPQNILWCEMWTIPLGDKSVDIVIAKHSLHYLSKWRLVQTIISISRILKPNGKFIFTVPHPFSNVFLKESKNYETEETIKFKAHDEFVLEYHSHQLKDYFSPVFLSLFDIKNICEFTKEENWIENFMVPVVLCVSATKKSNNMVSINIEGQ